MKTTKNWDPGSDKVKQALGSRNTTYLLCQSIQQQCETAIRMREWPNYGSYNLQRKQFWFSEIRWDRYDSEPSRIIHLRPYERFSRTRFNRLSRKWQINLPANQFLIEKHRVPKIAPSHWRTWNPTCHPASGFNSIKALHTGPIPRFIFLGIRLANEFC
jgi:hypothetical protein